MLLPLEPGDSGSSPAVLPLIPCDLRLVLSPWPQVPRFFIIRVCYIDSKVFLNFNISGMCFFESSYLEDKSINVCVCVFVYLTPQQITDKGTFLGDLIILTTNIRGNLVTSIRSYCKVIV